MFTSNLSTHTFAADQQSAQQGVVLFVKRTNEPLSPSNMRSHIDVHALKGSFLATLQSSLQGIWCPALLENQSAADALPSRVKQLLADLQTSLSTSVSQSSAQQGGRGGNNNGSNDLSHCADIFSVGDELAFWIRAKEDRRSPFRGLAKQVDAAFVDLQPFLDLKSLDPSALSDAIDVSLDALNAVYLAEASASEGIVYPQQRMAHLFDLIGKDIFAYVQRLVADCDVFNQRESSSSSSAQSSQQQHRAKQTLVIAIRLLEQWKDVPLRLTSTFWTNRQSANSWRGAVFEDVLCASFAQRLQEIVNLVTLVDELKQILPQAEQRAAGVHVDRLFDPLSASNPVFYNPYTDSQWRNAVREFEHRLAPIEAAVASKFRRDIAPYMDNAQLLLDEFARYKNLLARPSIRRATTTEREALMTLLREKMKQWETAVDTDELLPASAAADGKEDDDADGYGGASRKNKGGNGGFFYKLGGKTSSRLVSTILRLRQIGAKAVDILAASRVLFDDLQSSYTQYVALCEGLIMKCQVEQTHRFNAWLQDLNEQIAQDQEESDQDGGGMWSLQGSLLSWQSGILVVNFPEHLVRFLREYRALDELGFDLPKPSQSTAATNNKRGGKSQGKRNVADVALECEKYLRFGMLLKKTATFYNSISEQMIDVQEQLLLQSLTSFGQLVSNSTGQAKQSLTWRSPAECESFVQTLQSAAEKLSAENRALRQVHEWLTQQTVQLLQLDLHRQGTL